VPSTSDPDELWIGEAAKYVGRSVRSLQAWDRDGILRPAGRSATNRRFYTKTQLDAFLGRRREAVIPTRVIAYCRVSSSAQKPDLINQKRTLESFCAARGLAAVEWIDEVGGGLNFERQKFCAIMDAVERREVATLVIAHKDRLTRFGYAWFARLCANHGCELLVLNNEQLSPEREMVEDLMTIVHCFSVRLDGLRNYKKTLTTALKAGHGAQK